MVAAGYEWICPKCEKPNCEIEITETVCCVKCNVEFETDGAEHAYS